MSNLLANYTTCEISDALIKHGLPHGGHIPDILPLSPVPSTRICGPAYTVQMELFSHTSSPKLSSHFIDTAPEGCVIVIDAPRRKLPPSHATLKSLRFAWS
jgi:regulator of RNase E activity RraA